IEKLFDGLYGRGQQFRTATGSGIPHHYSLDLGVKAKLSRLIVHQRGQVPNEESLLYVSGNLRYYEIWGSNNPDPSGSYDGWEKLLDCESIKPSGLPYGQVSNEDKEYAQQGEEYKFSIDSPPVRYIRVKSVQTWGNTDYSNSAEITF